MFLRSNFIFKLMINDDILPAYSFVRTFNIELGRMLLIDHKLNIFLYFQ